MVVTIGVLILLAMPPRVPVPRAGPTARLSPLTTGGSPVYTNVSYNASTDGFPLSFGEILPSGFRATASYPLLVYLHGEGKSPAFVPGGSGDGLADYANTSRPSSRILIPLVDNASRYHFILLAPSPRSAEGFYTNSPCGGPEEQDTLDAIHVEETRHAISAVYLLGFSMGSLAALSFAGHHPGIATGVAVTGTFTDAFEEFAYHASPYSGLLSLTCSAWPSPANTTVDALYSYLSVTRFHPENFSHTALWVSAGGADHGAPDNLTLWPFEQVNATFVTSTCLVAASFGEPANCTTPFSALRAGNTSLYAYRFVFEETAGHTLAQLSPTDMFRFFLGKLPSGCFTSTFPPTRMIACP